MIALLGFGISISIKAKDVLKLTLFLVSLNEEGTKLNKPAVTGGQPSLSKDIISGS